jgi:hypothetical protein
LSEAEDYGDRLTAERVRRVSKGIPTAKGCGAQKGLGGSFTIATWWALDLDRFFAGKGASLEARCTLCDLYRHCQHANEPRKSWFGVRQAVSHSSRYTGPICLHAGQRRRRSPSLAKEIANQLRQAVLVTRCGAQKQLTEVGITFLSVPYSVHRVLGRRPVRALGLSNGALDALSAYLKLLSESARNEGIWCDDEAL